MSERAHHTEFEDGLPSYLGRLTQVPLLTADEEYTLTCAASKGDKRARQQLIEANMRLVINIARSYKHRSVHLEDLVQEGAIGLMQAAERFDPDRGYRFSTYATHWIRQAIGRAIDNKGKAIRLPAHIAQTLRRVEKERARLLRELGREPTAEMIATAMGINAKKLQSIILSSQDMLSLDMRVGDAGNTTLGGLIRDDNLADPITTILGQEMMCELDGIMAELNDREQRVMRHRFQLDGDNPAAPDDIAKELKISRERIRQIEVQAIKKLRAVAQRRKSREMLG